MIIYNQDIGMEFGIEKCAVRGMKKRGWVETTEGIEQTNLKNFKTLGEEKRKLKHWRKLETNTIKLEWKK